MFKSLMALLLVLYSQCLWSAKAWDSDSDKFQSGPGLSIVMSSQGRVIYSLCKKINLESEEFSQCEPLGREQGYYPEELLVLSDRFSNLSDATRRLHDGSAMVLDLVLVAASFYVAGRALTVGRAAFRGWFVNRYGIQGARKLANLSTGGLLASKKVAGAMKEGSHLLLGAYVFHLSKTAVDPSFYDYLLHPKMGIFKTANSNYWKRLDVLFNPKISNGNFNFKTIDISGLEMDALLADVEKFLNRIDKAHCRTPISPGCHLFRELEDARITVGRDAST